MKYKVIRNQRHKEINYTVLPVQLLQSWSILTTYAPIYYFYNIDSGWVYGEILPVIIVYDSHTKQNLLYKCIDMKIIPLKTDGKDFLLFTDIKECMEYCLYYCMQKYSTYPEQYPSHIPYEINYKKIDRLYKQFKAAYNNLKEGLLPDNYIKISNKVI